MAQGAEGAKTILEEHSNRKMDPIHPVPDGAKRVVLDTAVAAGQQAELEPHTWYYAICRDASDGFMKLGTAAVSAVDLTKNMPIIQNHRNVFYTGNREFVAVKATATLAAATKYVYFVKLAGDNDLG